MTQKGQHVWYNYRTQEYIEDDPTDETIADYLPQHPSALALYSLYRKGQLSMLDAMENVLLIDLDKEPKYKPIWPNEKPN